MATLLTDLVVKQAKVPQTGRVELWDEKVAGLLLRVTANDARSWSLAYRFKGAKRRLTLGDYRAEGAAGHGLTLGEARKAARAALRDVDDGRDPQGEKVAARRAEAQEARRQADTFTVLARRWVTSKAAAEWRPKTRAEFGRIVERELVPVLGDLAPEAVTKKHIRTLYDRIAARSESMAKHSLAVLRLLYLWAADEDHVDAMPVFPKRGTQSNRRTRVLEDAELRAVCNALDGGIGKEPEPGRVEMMAEAFRLMLLTGQRRGEVLSMRWDDVTEEKDGAWWTIPAERHKGGRDHRVPLTAPAVDALKRLHTLTGSEPWIFPAPKGGAKLPYVGNRAEGGAAPVGRVRSEGSHHPRSAAIVRDVHRPPGRAAVGGREGARPRRHRRDRPIRQARIRPREACGASEVGDRARPDRDGEGSVDGAGEGAPVGAFEACARRRAARSRTHARSACAGARRSGHRCCDRRRRLRGRRRGVPGRVTRDDAESIDALDRIDVAITKASEAFLPPELRVRLRDVQRQVRAHAMAITARPRVAEAHRPRMGNGGRPALVRRFRALRLTKSEADVLVCCISSTGCPERKAPPVAGCFVPLRRVPLPLG